jgi:Tfp pilus assembly protein PilN
VVRRINLVPAGERRRTQTDLGLLAVVGIAMVAIGLMAVTYFNTSGQLSEKDTQLAELQMQNQQLQSRLTSLAGYSTLQEQKKQAQTVAEQVYQQRTLVSEVLGDISLVVPDNVWFTKIAITAPPIQGPEAGAAGAGSAAAPVKAGAPAVTGGGKLSIEGTTFSFEDVSRLLVRLQQVPSLKEISLTKAAGATSGTSGTSAESTTKKTKTMTVEATVINAQPLNTSLPIALTEVQGQ